MEREGGKSQSAVEKSEKHDLSQVVVVHINSDKLVCTLDKI